jgi:UPF0755 protein
VAERRERTPAEREAARREREARRAGRPSRPPEAPLFEPPPEAPLFERRPETPAEDGRADGRGPEDDHAAEAPSGTRKITALERARTTRAGRPPGRPRGPAAGAGGRRRIAGRVLALVALAIAAGAIWFAVELFQPFHGAGHGHLEVTIPRNASASAIGDQLARRGVIASGFFFDLRARLDGDRGRFYAGTYRLRYGMSYAQVLRILTTAPPAPKTAELTLIPGHSRAQVAAILHREGIAGSYLAATRHSPLLNPASYGAPRSTPDLEGFLFPDTYQLRVPIRISQLVADQLETFKAQFAKVNMSYARAHHLTPYDVLIIASMVEAEAASERDRLLVASVIYNRLRLGMPLQIDATTRYATGNYTRPLTESQLQSPSPYNTRIHSGLPPTPIDSPSLASIEAAARPAQTDYLYFVVRPCGNGEMTFTASAAQFDADVAAYDRARAARGGNSPEFCRRK